MYVITHVFSDLPPNLLWFLSLVPFNYKWLFCYEAGTLPGGEGMHLARHTVMTIAVLWFTAKTHNSTPAKRVPPEGQFTVWGASRHCCLHEHHGHWLYSLVIWQKESRRTSLMSLKLEKIYPLEFMGYLLQPEAHLSAMAPSQMLVLCTINAASKSWKKSWKGFLSRQNSMDEGMKVSNNQLWSSY